jgi:hypothetical protein
MLDDDRIERQDKELSAVSKDIERNLEGMNSSR